MASFKDLIYECMSPEERGAIDDFGLCAVLDDFCLWAFGENISEFSDSVEFMREWNKLHGEDLYIYPTGVIDEDIPKMLSLWIHEKEN